MDFSRETLEKLKIFIDLLIKWHKTINLISEKTVLEIWNRHVVDSAQVLPFISSVSSVIDVGTGAGFPGLILSIIGKLNVHLVEPDQKKCVFLQEAIRITSSEAVLHNCRVEKLNIQTFDVLVSRAFSSIENFLNQTFHLKNPNSRCIFLKGPSFQKELDQALKKWHFDYALHSSCTHSEGKIIILSNLRKINGS